MCLVVLGVNVHQNQIIEQKYRVQIKASLHAHTFFLQHDAFNQNNDTQLDKHIKETSPKKTPQTTPSSYIHTYRHPYMNTYIHTNVYIHM